MPYDCRLKIKYFCGLIKVKNNYATKEMWSRIAQKISPCAITYFALNNIQNLLEHLGALYSISHLIVFTKIQDYWNN